VGREIQNNLRRLAGSRNKKAEDPGKCQIPQNTHQKVVCMSKRSHVEVETSKMGSDAWEMGPVTGKGVQSQLAQARRVKKTITNDLVNPDHLGIRIKRHSASHQSILPRQEGVEAILGTGHRGKGKEDPKQLGAGLQGHETRKQETNVKCLTPRNTHQKVVCLSKHSHLEVETSKMGSDA